MRRSRAGRGRGRGPRGGVVGRARSALLALACLGLSFPLAPVAAAQGAVAAATAEARRQLDALEALLDPAEHDVDSLALELAFEEPEAIAAWVAENVGLELYAGLLRGPQGTLVAGAGNALDQSVLLARLLNDAGYEARVALGELTDALATELVMSMFVAGAGASQRDARSVTDVASSVASATGADTERAAAGLSELTETELRDLPAYAEAVAQAEALLAQLGRPVDPVMTDELVAEARDYAWVEYRLSEAEPWTPAHPAWPASAALPAVAAVSHLDGEVPAELTHRLRIEVSIERKRGDEFEVEPLMTPWERPVANLLGHTVVVGNSPMGETGPADLARVGAELVDVAFFVPVLDGAIAPGAQAFDLNGNLVPPDAAASHMAGVFQTGAERLGGAIGALGAMGGDAAPAEPFALTAQWIDFVLVAPGGEETRHRRTVFDRRPAEARAAGGDELLDRSVLKDGLVTTYAVMASGGRLSPSFVASELGEQAAFHLAVLERLAQAPADGEAADEAALLLDLLADYVPKDHLRLIAASDGIDGTLDGLAYRAEPALFALFGSFTPTEEGRARSGVDVIANAKRTLVLDGGDVVQDFEGSVLAGVWDTVIEREFVAGFGGPVATALRQDRPEGYRVVTAGDTTGLREAGAPDEALTALRADLDNGYAVVVPQRSSVDPEGFAYWRVDLASGETLGMDASGRGNAMTEFLMSLAVGLTVNAALAVPSLIQCASSSNPALCYCDVIASGVLFSFLGALLGALFVAERFVAVIVTYTIVDVTVIGPVTTFFTPPVCSGYAGGPPNGREALAVAGAAGRCVAS